MVGTVLFGCAAQMSACGAGSCFLASPVLAQTGAACGTEAHFNFPNHLGAEWSFVFAWFSNLHDFLLPIAQKDTKLPQQFHVLPASFHPAIGYGARGRLPPRRVTLTTHNFDLIHT